MVVMRAKEARTQPISERLGDKDLGGVDKVRTVAFRRCAESSGNQDYAFQKTAIQPSCGVSGDALAIGESLP